MPIEAWVGRQRMARVLLAKCMSWKKETIIWIENLSWWVSLCLPAYPIGSDEITRALQQIGLNSELNIPCHFLSAGQQRRVALARLLLSQQRVWILDEPFTALDHSGISQIENCIKRHQSSGGMVIMTSHYKTVLGLVWLKSCFAWVLWDSESYDWSLQKSYYERSLKSNTTGHYKPFIMIGHYKRLLWLIIRTQSFDRSLQSSHCVRSLQKVIFNGHYISVITKVILLLNTN